MVVISKVNRQLREHSKHISEQIASFVQSERLRNGYTSTNQMAIAQSMYNAEHGGERDKNTLRQRIRYIEEARDYKFGTLLRVLDFLGYTLTIRTKNSALVPASLAPIRRVNGYKGRSSKKKLSDSREDIARLIYHPKEPVGVSTSTRQLNDLWALMKEQGMT